MDSQESHGVWSHIESHAVAWSLGHGLLDEGLGLREPVSEGRVQVVGNVGGDEDSCGREVDGHMLSDYRSLTLGCPHSLWIAFALGDVRGRLSASYSSSGEVGPRCRHQETQVTYQTSIRV